MTQIEYGALKLPGDRVAAYEKLLEAQKQCQHAVALTKTTIEDVKFSNENFTSLCFESEEAPIHLIGLTRKEWFTLMLPLLESKLAQIRMRMEEV